MRHAIALVLSFLAASASAQPWHEHGPREPVTSIGFAACYAADKDAPITDALLDRRHDAFVFLGDNVYADIPDVGARDLEDEQLLREKDRAFRAKWDELTGRRWFRTLARRSHVLATWDDHDYGVNDGGASYNLKEIAKSAFLDAFGERENSDRRETPGVYDAVTLGPAGRRVQVVLLDTRTFRDRLEELPRRDREFADGVSGNYAPTSDTSRTMLGETQWRWFAEQLKKPADLRVIVSSIQVLPTDHGWESWALFPHERDRFFRTIAGAGNVVVVSGDRHKSEVSVSRAEEVAGAPGAPVAELTVGSLNKAYPWYNEINRRRVGSVYHPVAFGELEIDWGAGSPAVTLRVRGEDGDAVIEHALRFDE